MSRKLMLPMWALIYPVCAGCAVNPVTGEQDPTLVSADYTWLTIDLAPDIDICSD